MKVEQAKQIASNAIEELSTALERGHSEGMREYLKAMARFHRYSAYNIMLILSQRPNARRVAGYQTWKEFGRFVKKGAKGILVFAPIVRKRSGEELNPEAESTKVILGFRAVYVFDLADTDGQDLPRIGETEGDPAGYTNRGSMRSVPRTISNSTAAARRHLLNRLNTCNAPAQKFSLRLLKRIRFYFGRPAFAGLHLLALWPFTLFA